MFEYALLESTTDIRSQNRWPAVISFTVQTIFVVALLAIPLLHPASLVSRSFPTELAPPAPIILPPQPMSRVPMPTAPAATTNTMSAPVPSQPIHISRLTEASSGPAPTVIGVDLTGGSATNPALSIGGGGGGTSSPKISVASASPGHSIGLHAVSTGVSQGLLLTTIGPVYPPIAIAAHQQGMVTVEAVISTTGRVESAHAVSGPAMLQGSAVDAVRSARYRPFLLNGQPTEVAATFSINFNLGGQ